MSDNYRQNFLRENSVFWSRLGFGFDPPQMDEQGHHRLFSRNFQNYVRIHEQFSDAGVRIHSTILPSGWLGVGHYDYSTTDEILDALLRDHPDWLYLPRVKLNVPVGWCRENPRDVFVYANGPRREDEIRQLVGTLQQDWLGYESATGYGVNGGTFRDNRPNVGGLIGLQSFASDQWLADAGEALRRLVVHLEDGPYAANIVGYHLAFGNCGESTLWGAWTNKITFKGDYGINAREAFYQWGLRKYQSETALCRTWQITAGDYQERTLPTVGQRFLQTESLPAFFRSRESDTMIIDYSLFTSDMNARAIEHFCRTVHVVVPDKAAGAFYGYIVGVAQSAYAGHLAIDQLLQSPEVDFLSSPKGYYRCAAGEPGLDQASATSINRRKVWLDEIDPVTHLDVYRKGSDQAKSFLETRSVLWREFAKNMAWSQGYWWMDLGEGAFDSPAVMAEIARMETIRKEICQPTVSISEILLVVDDNSMHFHNPSHMIQEDFIKEFASNVKHCGAPVDLYRFADLQDLDISGYKVVIFLNQFVLDQVAWQDIHARIRPAATVIWHYAAGIVSPGAGSPGSLTGKEADLVVGRRFDLDQVRQVTGMRIRPHVGAKLQWQTRRYAEAQETDLPLIEIETGPNVDALKCYADGAPMVGSRKQPDGGRSILCCLPELNVEELRSIFSAAQVHLYAPAHTAVYGNAQFIAVFTACEIQSELLLRGRHDVMAVISDIRYAGVDRLPLVLPAGDCAFFRILS